MEVADKINIKELLLNTVYPHGYICDDFQPLIDSEYHVVEDSKDCLTDENRLVSSIASLLINLDDEDTHFNKLIIQDLIAKINNIVNSQINEVLHNKKFQELESVWRSLNDLASSCDNDNVRVDILDVTMDEISEDFDCNSIDITGSSLFKKIYAGEYDQFGGEPYASIIGLYNFSYTQYDELWLRNIAKLANLAHCPFISAVSPQFFGCDSVKELSDLKDLKGLLEHPKYSSWQQFRETEEAAYLGLTLPRYLLRSPYIPTSNSNDKNELSFFREDVCDFDDSKFLWGNAAVLFAKNMIQSFIHSGWCQYIRGPRSGGMIDGLPVHVFEYAGSQEIKIPVEFAMPDYRELEFSEGGFIPLVYYKNSSKACFFSCQAVKKPEEFINSNDRSNSQMVTNLAYTFSITRIAHYVKAMLREYIGSTANDRTIESMLNNWIMKYVTDIANPDDLSLRKYPFKQAAISVKNRPGEIGWYKCSIRILPHLQFEGMDVELRLDSNLAAIV